MISDSLPKLIHNAMKEDDNVRVSTLKLLSSELHNAKIKKGQELSSEEELNIIKKEAKKRTEAVEFYKKAAKADKAKAEQSELEILKDFLPEELSDDEIAAFVNDAIAQISGPATSQFGQVMSLVMQKVSGRADGSRVAAIVKKSTQ